MSDTSTYGASFYDAKVLPNGVCVCAGTSTDSTGVWKSLLLRINPLGKILQKRLYVTNNTIKTYYNSETAHAITVAKNGDLLMPHRVF